VLEVAVSDSATWVVLRDKVSLDVVRERKAPDVGLLMVVEVDATHSSFGSVGGS